MALFNEIQVGRFNGQLHKLLDMKEGAPSPQLAGDIQPGIVLENDRPEFAFLGGTRLCAASLTVAALAANQSAVRLAVPTPGILVIVTEVRVVAVTAAAGATQGFVLVLNTTDATGFTGTEVARDRRFAAPVGAGGDAVSAQIEGYQAAVGTGSLAETIRIEGQRTGAFMSPPYVLLQGTNLTVRTTGNNESLTVSFKWYERALEQSETR